MIHRKIIIVFLSHEIPHPEEVTGQFVCEAGVEAGCLGLSLAGWVAPAPHSTAGSTAPKVNPAGEDGFARMTADLYRWQIGAVSCYEVQIMTRVDIWTVSTGEVEIVDQSEAALVNHQ